jgi:dipeptidyl aminopeptidase/acylaminoacyl peptidase
MVSASGGVVRPATTFDRKKSELLHSWPFFLPDGRHFLYEVDFSGGRASVMKVGELGSQQARELGSSDGRVEYTGAGYIVFLRERTLLAQSFDARGLKTRGDPFPVAENVVVSGEAGNFSVSQRGDLVFRSEPNSEQSLLVWLDRGGRRLGFAAPPGPYQDIALSPDGGQVAMSQVDPATNHNDIWVRQLARGVSTRLTFTPSDEIWPVWSPDGARLAYASDRGGEFRSYARLVSGVGSEDSLGHQPGGNEGPTDWSRDGHWILTAAASPSNRWDIWMMSAEPGAKPALWLRTPFVERDARFSPDGRWVAYTSNESGHPEVYARPASGSNGKWQVSNAGGSSPHWRRDGKELFYQTPERSIVAVPIRAGEALEIGTPVTLFEARLFVAGYSGPRWDVTADGQRFLVNTTPGDAGSARLTVVRNWAAEAKKR